MPAPAIAVVIVTYGSAAALPGTLGALRPQLRAGDELVVVDNASRDGSAAAARALAPGALVLETGVNAGFAAGCNLGARSSAAPLLLFLNPDARVEPGCLDALRAVAAERPAWGAWQALVLLPGGERVNTSGNLVHWLGFGWAGGCEQPAAAVPDTPYETTFASGAALAVRRAAWDAAGGFDERYFMYGEDLELGLRLWLAGWGVGVAPAARVVHDYDFEKGPQKWFLLERNRWRTVLSLYPAPLLALLAPALLAFELALLPVAARDGWLGAKLRAQAAALRSLPDTLRRRRACQALKRTGDAAFAARLTASLDSPYLATAQRVPPLAAAQAVYWAAVRRLLAR